MVSRQFTSFISKIFVSDQIIIYNLTWFYNFVSNVCLGLEVCTTMVESLYYQNVTFLQYSVQRKLRIFTSLGRDNMP